LLRFHIEIKNPNGPKTLNSLIRNQPDFLNNDFYDDENSLVFKRNPKLEDFPTKGKFSLPQKKVVICLWM